MDNSVVYKKAKEALYLQLAQAQDLIVLLPSIKDKNASKLVRNVASKAKEIINKQLDIMSSATLASEGGKYLCQYAENGLDGELEADKMNASLVLKVLDKFIQEQPEKGED